MTTQRAYRTNKLQGSLLVGASLALIGLAGCQDGTSDDAEQSTRTVPSNVTPQPATMVKAIGPVNIMFYKDYNAWIFENRNEITLEKPPFNLVNGVDYEVRSTAALREGIPEDVELVILESNSFGKPEALENINHPDAQNALDAYLMQGGVVVAHLASMSLGEGYTVPGLTGSVNNDGDSNTLRIPDGKAHPFIWGPDGVPNTDDDASNSSIQWLGTTSAHNGSLNGILPANADVLIQGENDAPIYAEYQYGAGRVIVGSLTFEYGMDFFDPESGMHFGYGQRDRLLVNHFYSALTEPVDEDEDGVYAASDCDDDDSSIGRLLFEDDFSSNTGFFDETDPLSRDEWVFDAGLVSANGPSQQALLGHTQQWDNTVIYAVISPGQTEGGCASNGSTTGCDDPTTGEINRWRAGILTRARATTQTDEGYAGFRCALSSNAETISVPHDGPSTGQFLQLALFDDLEEDDIGAECEAGLNTTFDELALVDYEGFDFTETAAVEMTFYSVGNRLHCSVTDGATTVTAEAWSDTFANGTVGLSTLNMHGQFDYIRVCEASALPSN